MKALAMIAVIPFAALYAGENNGRGVKAIALANAFVARADNSWATAYNPAGLAQILTPEISAFFVPQQFGIPELRTVSCSAASSIGAGSVGVLAEQFGFELYKSTEVMVGYGIAVDSSVSVGATVDIQRMAIERYGASTNLTMDVGILGKPRRDISVGVSFRNALAAKLRSNGERLPQYLLLGVSYSPIHNFLLTTEVEKDVAFPLVVKAGVEQRFVDFLSLRCGVANNPDKFSVGLAVRYSSLEFGYAGYSHPDLGWTHQVEISWR